MSYYKIMTMELQLAGRQNFQSHSPSIFLFLACHFLPFSLPSFLPSFLTLFVFLTFSISKVRASHSRMDYVHEGHCCWKCLVWKLLHGWYEKRSCLKLLLLLTLISSLLFLEWYNRQGRSSRHLRVYISQRW